MAAYQYVYVMKDLQKTYTGGKQVLKPTTLSFLPGAKIGLIGENGAGKSTLMKIIAGLDTDFTGEAWAAEGAKVGYLSQEPQLDENKTVEQNVMEGLGEAKTVMDEYEAISAKFAEEMSDDEMNALIEKQAALQEKIDAMDAWDINRTVEIAMDALRCPPGDWDVKKLSGGEKRRVALCKLLLQKPDILLLDEPTNHLDAETVAWLERHLQDYKGCVILVTHDRYFLDNVVEWVLELERGSAYPFEGNYSAWLDFKRKRLMQEQREEDSRQRQLSSELDWINSNPKARQAKSKARINSYQELLAQSQQKASGPVRIAIPPGPRLGDVVVEVENLSKGFEQKLLIDELNFRLPPGGIVGVIGPNGAGKSTLMRMIVGDDKPDEGILRLGDSVKLGYVDQSRDDLDANKNVWEEISGGDDEIDLGNRTVKSRAYVSLFGFRGPDQQKKVGQLSGGERNRVHMAKLLKEPCNLLLLDEPSNDLDVDTLRALEDALMEYPGCAVVVSHDRWFLDRIATHILAFEGNSHVEWFEGNYSDYEKDYKSRVGEEALQPHRIKYKPLTRKAG